MDFGPMFAAIDVGIGQGGGRLIPRSVVLENGARLAQAYREINDSGAQVIGIAVNVNTSHKSASNTTFNSASPAWRTTLIDSVIATLWKFTAPRSETDAQQDLMTDVVLPEFEALTPDGGCYMNEGDFKQPGLQHVFCGGTYERLLAVREKSGLEHVFWATMAAGSEYCVPQDESGKGTGRLCKARQ